MTAAELAAVAYIRTSACTVALPMDEREGEGECPECLETVPVLLIPVDDETALAACMHCGWRFHQYIGQD
jgi:hypothetical protein